MEDQEVSDFVLLARSLTSEIQGSSTPNETITASPPLALKSRGIERPSSTLAHQSVRFQPNYRPESLEEAGDAGRESQQKLGNAGRQSLEEVGRESLKCRK